mgnify:FL=1
MMESGLVDVSAVLVEDVVLQCVVEDGHKVWQREVG